LFAIRQHSLTPSVPRRLQAKRQRLASLKAYLSACKTHQHTPALSAHGGFEPLMLPSSGHGEIAAGWSRCAQSTAATSPQLSAHPNHDNPHNGVTINGQPWAQLALQLRRTRAAAAAVWQLGTRQRRLLRSSKQLLSRTLTQYRLYRRVNLYSEAFHVEFRDSLAWINGCPLGRVSGGGEDWRAVNSALGFAAIMLNTLGARLNFNFPVHLIIPMGSYSKLANAGNKKGTLDL